jgi:hypothetical protein
MPDSDPHIPESLRFAGALMLDIVYLHVRVRPAAAIPDAWPDITASSSCTAARRPAQ